MTYPHGGASQIWRDGDGGSHNPEKGQIRDWGAAVESGIDAAASTAVAQTQEHADAAAASVVNAQAAARTCATWAVLVTLTGAAEGEGAEVLDDDAGTHPAASATGYDGASISNGGRYSWNATWSRWVRIGSTGLSGKASAEEVNRRVPTYAAPLVGDWVELVLDVDGLPIRGTKVDGSVWEAQGGVLVAVEGASLPAATSYDYEATTGTHFYDTAEVDVLVLITGQSLSVGGGADGGVITSTPEHSGYALMPSCGVRVDGQAFSGYVDLYEQEDGGRGETVASGMADAIMRRLSADLGEKKRLIFAVQGLGGQAFYGDPSNADGGLKRGSWNYEQTLDLVRKARDVAISAGRHLIVPAVVIIHGEEDYKAGTGTSNAEYERALTQWRLALEEDIRKITEQRDALRAYVSQANRAQTLSIGVDLRTPQAALDAADRDPMIVCAGPNYFVADSGDGSHPDNRGYRRMGEMFGDVLARDLFGAYFTPLRIERAYFTASDTVRLEYDRDVAVDTSGTLISVAGLGNGYGIDFDDGSGSPPTVSSLSVSGGNIDVTLSSTPTGLRSQIFVAARTTATGIGNTNGARSCIREATSFDTDPDDSQILYHWHCHQQVPVPYSRA